MKQKGKSWITHEGKSTEAKWVPAHLKIQERTGQIIASLAMDLNRHLKEAKTEMITLSKEALRNTPGTEDVKTRFTFTTFDREFKIEYDLKDENVRVYLATRINPGHKDYEYIDLSFSAVPTTTQGVKPSKSLQDFFEQVANYKEFIPEGELAPEPEEDLEGGIGLADAIAKIREKEESKQSSSDAEREEISEFEKATMPLFTQPDHGQMFGEKTDERGPLHSGSNRGN